LSGSLRGLTELLGTEHPVVQAPMAGAATPELAAAVSEAGGLGSLGSAALTPADLGDQLGAFRALSARPVNLNFFCHESPELQDAESARTGFRSLYAEVGIGEPPTPVAPPIRFDSDRLAAVLDLRPEVVSFHFGLPDERAVGAIREAGSVVLGTATTVEEAVALEERGADVVIAQGAEAGGHRGSFLVAGDEGPVGTLALVPQVVDAVDAPVLAAGGIVDGRGLVAAIALGAGGAQIGTAFLACPETAIHPLHREALLAARAESTTITRAISGRPARAIRNRITERRGDEPLPFPAQLSLTGPLGAAAAERGSAAFLAMWAGQGAPLASELPAGEVVAGIVAEAERVRAELATR
jgi:nitronate monooxygenase